MYPKETGIYLTLLTGAGVLMVMVVFFMVSIFRQQKRRIREIKGQVLRDMSLIEEERKRISGDLHDDLGSTLSAVRMKLGDLADENQGNELIRRLIDNVDRSSARIREIAHNLLPGILSARGLSAAIDELVEDIRSSRKFKVIYSNTSDDRDFNPAKSILVFRIIQEILANAIKHAEATRIEILVSTEGSNLSIRISDNGKGFDHRRVDLSGKHFGLQNIHSRLELLDAQYSLPLSPGEGTRYQINIPLFNMQTDYEKGFTH